VLRRCIAEERRDLAAAHAQIAQLVLAHRAQQAMVLPRAARVADQRQNGGKESGLGRLHERLLGWSAILQAGVLLWKLRIL
jgi:hypothetical protein